MADLLAGPAVQNLSIVRGDSKTYDGAAKRVDGTVVNLTGARIWFTVKRKLDDVDALAVVRKDTVDGGVSITNAALGLFQIVIEPVDLAALANLDQVLVYDVQIKDAVGKIFTAQRGKLAVLPEVTRAT